MHILDTNVISELMRPEPDGRVIGWVSEQPVGSLFTTAVSEAELRYGVALLLPGQRRVLLTEALNQMMEEDFSGRILPFDRSAARAFADIVATRRQRGRPISQFDAQIAAIARSRDAAVATRNDRDFSDCGLAVFNPWEG